jgi:hypothetical protein
MGSRRSRCGRGQREKLDRRSDEDIRRFETEFLDYLQA